MAYCTQSDLEEQISGEDLIALSDDEGNGLANANVIGRAIADADAEIDSYAGSRYAIPLSPVPVMIRKLSVDIAIYNLFNRRSLNLPDARLARYENAIRFLRDLAKGLVSMGADAPAEPDDGLPQATRTAADRIFTIGKKSSGSAGTLDNY